MYVARINLNFGLNFLTRYMFAGTWAFLIPSESEASGPDPETKRFNPGNESCYSPCSCKRCELLFIDPTEKS